MIAENNSLIKLPSAWTWTRLEECVDILDGQRVPINSDEREKRLGGIPYYGATGQVGWIDDYLFDEELVLLGEDGAPFLDPYKHKAYIINGKSWVNNHAHVLRVIKEIVSNPLVCYYLNSFNYRDYISGTTRYKLNQAPMRKIPLPLPPLPEQHRIVAKIEELFTRLDAGVEALKKIQLQLKRYRQSVLKSAFEGRLTAEWREAHQGELEPASVLLEKIKTERKKSGKYKGLPPLDTSDLPELSEGWVWTRVGEITEVNPKLEYELANNTEVSFLPMRSVEAMTGKINLSIIKPYEEVRKGFTHFQNGDLLFAKITPCMENGKVAIVNNLHNGIGFGSTEFHVIRPFGQISVKALFFYVLQESFRKDAQREMTGTAGQLRVPAKYLSDVSFPLSPVSEQQQIIEEIDRCFSVADAIEKTIEQSLKQSERLRQSVLKRAFEGRLVSQDPSDEPAEKLLERIRAEKAKNQTNTKRRRAAIGK